MYIRSGLLRSQKGSRGAAETLAGQGLPGETGSTEHCCLFCRLSIVFLVSFDIYNKFGSCHDVVLVCLSLLASLHPLAPRPSHPWPTIEALSP